MQGRSDQQPRDKSEPVKKCHGLKSGKYVSRGPIKEIVEEEFCTAVYSQAKIDIKECAMVGHLDEKSGAVARTFMQGTQEEVHIAMDWPPGFHPVLNVTECRRIFVDHLIDGCDGNDPENPMNWKGGGEYRDGKITYRIEPRIKRQPAPKTPSLTCSREEKRTVGARNVDVYLRYTLTGGGFEGANQGKIIRNWVEWCPLLAYTRFVFNYTFTESEKEWIARFSTHGRKSGCVEEAIQNAGGPWKLKC